MAKTVFDKCIDNTRLITTFNCELLEDKYAITEWNDMNDIDIEGEYSTLYVYVLCMYYNVLVCIMMYFVCIIMYLYVLLCTLYVI